MVKLIKVVHVTTVYVITGTANSSSPVYWEKDFKESNRYKVGEGEEKIVEGLRELTQVEMFLDEGEPQ